MTVHDLKIGQKAIIKVINSDEKIKKRLLALGCVEGTEIQVKKVAPLSDPIVVTFRGFDMAIRKNTAQKIQVKTLI
ncbi:FeoA family protein [Romboutsia lituseburensis]|uniref:FeoA family protein n=1 Tax=Romboutsia lituseburensis TaxID=1537 RepID=UPI00215A61E9|nr:ferrous iron transport protein A [Romboutsia lituseburensis]MCR8746931.1 ferrous iron transport protein A [Romboutsia lituseburensis]